MAPYNTLRGTSPDFIDEFYKFSKGNFVDKRPMSESRSDHNSKSFVALSLRDLLEFFIRFLVNQYTKGAGKRARFKP